MRFTLSWLKDFLDTDANLEQISEKLTLIGLEVEDIIDYKNSLSEFKVAEIVEAVAHPEADRLKLCKVNTGKEILQIVCGASNARAGIKVVLANVGATIPLNGIKIKVSKIRNVESHGMICSARELGIGDEHEGIIELNSEAILGDNFTKYLGIDDPIIEIAITPNRGDCLGVYGIARDLSAAGIGKLKPIEIPEVKTQFESPIQISKNICPLFVGYYIKDVANKESPDWLKNRLKAIKTKPISLIVDITNYINFTFARPLHAYDADKINGNIQIRKADGEKLLALNEKEYELKDDIVIADEHKILAIAGIIGGLDSACELSSRNIFLESALFEVNPLIESGRKHKIETDSRYRFERNIDPDFTEIGAKLALKMILELGGGKVSKPVISRINHFKPRELIFNPLKVLTIGGCNITLERIKLILKDLGFGVNEESENLRLLIPGHRNDISIEEDIVEEIIRINGYDKVPCNNLPFKDMIYTNGFSDDQKRINIIKRKLAASGLHEVVSFSFIETSKAKLFSETDSNLEILNPISNELSYMRNSLYVNLLDISIKNINRGFHNQCLFEFGKIFKSTNILDQQDVFAGLRIGKISEKNHYKEEREYDFYDVKADVRLILEEALISFDNVALNDNVPHYYHPNRAACINLGKSVIGYFGDLHPKILQKFDIKLNVVAFEVFIDKLPQAKEKKIRKLSYQISDYQAVSRDFAFIVNEELRVDTLLKTVKSVDKNLIKDVRLFDVYQGDKIDGNKKSVAINVILQAFDRTLTEEEIDQICNKIIMVVTEKLQAKLRNN